MKDQSATQYTNAVQAALARVEKFSPANDEVNMLECSSEYSDSYYTDCPGE